MKYLKIDIPSYIVPEKGYILDKGIYIIPSQMNLLSQKDQEIHLTFLITEESGHLNNIEDVKNCVKSFIVFLNFISYSVHSATWLQTANFKEIYETISEATNIQEMLDFHMEKQKSQAPEFYHDYNNLALQIFSPNKQLQTKVDFISLFEKYNKLDKNSLLKQRINLLSFTSIQFALINKYCDNQNIEISLIYTILDSIIKESLNNKPIIKKCENCGFETTGKMNKKTRINEFIKLLDLENPNLWRDIIWNLYIIRNEFFYQEIADSTIETSKEAFEIELQETDKKSISTEEEIHYKKSQILGLESIKMLIKKILIGYLESCP